jgi:cell division protein FtsL
VLLGIAALSIRSPKNERSREHAQVRQLQTVMGYLPTRLTVSEQAFLIAAILIALVVAIVVIFGRFVFARTARQSLLEV